MKSIIFASLLFLNYSVLSAEDFHNSIGMKFVDIPSGSYIMGRDEVFENGSADELPMHEVSLKSFYLADTEVTQQQWVKVMGRSNPSEFKGRHYPVENVSYLDAKLFIKKLNEMERTTKYRLPSEAEWEYAARAGSKSKWSFSDEEKDLKEYAWYDENSEDTTHPVGQKKPNKFKLYDMHGNLWEWVEDCYFDTYLQTAINKNALKKECKQSTTKHSINVLRGGSWMSDSSFTRSAVRYYNSADFKIDYYGFRVARTK